MILDPQCPPEPDDYYMGITLAVRRRANCKGSRVGAIIVKNNRIISTGYNGVPEGMTNCLDGGCFRCSSGRFDPGKGYDLCICVHAEQNALLAAARFGISVEGAHLYTTKRPCYGCAKELLQAHISRVFYIHPWVPKDESNAEIDAGMKKEYQKILGELHITQLDSFNDPAEQWAAGKTEITKRAA
jgi:dCMP deaminase